MINDELNKIEAVTLEHYQARAQSFWQGTRDHDVTQNYAAFLQAMSKNRVLDILDFGCGPGRDVKYFKLLGHNAVGLDGCSHFCQMAREYSGCKILHQTFLHLNLLPNAFDGIFANASLFHIPGKEFLRVLKQLHAALKPGGILFSSNPRGNHEGWNGDRYGSYIQFEKSKSLLESAGFEVLDHYYRPAGKPQAEQPWLAIVSRKN